MGRKSIIFGLGSFAVTASLACGGTAQARAGDGATTAAQAEGQAAAGAPEIIVTAERRKGTVQTTPLAINVISGAAIQQRGLSSGKDLGDVVPGVKLFHERGGTSIFVRGIGNSASNPYADSDVAYNVDGVAMTLPSGASGQMYDLARLEVLKGPQGTLYGRNATAGAINAVSNDPEFTTGGYVNATLGSYNQIGTEGALNLPLSDTFALRAAFHTDSHDGYLSNGLNDSGEKAARIKALWKPNEKVRLLLGADISIQNSKGDQRVPINASTGQLYWQARNAANDPWHMENAMPSPVGGTTTLIPGDVHTINRNWGVFAQLDVDLGPAALTVLPSYRSYHQDWKDADNGFGFEQKINDHSRSLEVRLASTDRPGNRFRWVAGGFWLDESLPNWVRVQQSYPVDGSGTATLRQVTDQPYDVTRSLAFFGQATYSVLPHLRLTGGARWTKDFKHQIGTTTNDVAPGLSYTFNQDWTVRSTKATWRVGFDADVGPRSMLYGNISTGYKAGGFSAGPTPGLTPGLSVDPALVPLLTYKPEELTAFDLGIKNSFFDRKLTLNLEAFWWKYKNQQVQTIFLLFLPSLPPVIVPSVVNAGRGTDRGVELEATYKVTPDDQIGLQVEYLDTKYGSFSYPFIFANSPVDNSGKPFINAPKLSGSVDYTHVWHLNSGAKVTAHAATRFSTGYWVGYSYAPKAAQQSAYTNTELSLEYGAKDAAWFARGWVRNLENRAIRSSVGAAVPGSTSAPAPVGTDGQSLYWGSLQPPRTYGITLGARF